MKNLFYTIVVVVTFSMLTGCQSMPWSKSSKPAEPPELAAMRNQIQQYQAKTTALEASNAQVNIQLAQTKQSLMQEQECNKRGNESYQLLAQENFQLKKERSELIAKNNEQTRQLAGVKDALNVNGTTAIVPNNTNIPTVDFNDIPNVYARVDGQFYRVSIPSEELFAEDQTTLTDTGKEKLTTVAQRLTANFGQRQFRIEAHTIPIQEVSTGDSATNTPQKLTVAQATAVSDVVVTAGAIPQESVSVMGCGSTQPMVSMSTPEGQAMNKRIEFVVLP